MRLNSKCRHSKGPQMVGKSGGLALLVARSNVHLISWC